MKTILHIRIILFLGVVLMPGFSGCSFGSDIEPIIDIVHRGELPGYASYGYGGIVVTEDSLATETAVRVLRRGGNAVDAAVAAAFALAVTLPEAGNLGGGGFMVVRDPKTRELWSLDFREKAPLAATPDMYQKLADSGNKEVSKLGAIAAGIPGTTAGLHAAWKKSGTVRWEQLVAPAIQMARSGIEVNARLHKNLNEKRDELLQFESTRSVFFRNGEPIQPGYTLTQPDLANALEQIAGDGPAAFYTGDIADRLVDAVSAAGGIWSKEDISGYQPVFRKPIRIALDKKKDIELVTMGPPSSGWLVFGQALTLLEGLGSLRYRHDDPRRVVDLVEVLRLAFADRNTQLADPKHMTATVDGLLSHDYLDKRMELFPSKMPGDSRQINGGMPKPESDNTTHIVVIDDQGGVVSLSTTLNATLGGKWVVPGVGILLNNQMDDFDTRPGEPNLYGLVGTGVNAVRPGARMLSSMSPSIVLRDGDVWFALGARGGPRIISAVLQVILHRWNDAMPLPSAVATPRVHHQWWPDTIFLEKSRQLPRLWSALEAMGYALDTKPTIGRVIAAERLPTGGYVGVRDPRITGLARTVEPYVNER